MAKMLVPETEQPKTAGRVVMNADEEKTEKEAKFAWRDCARHHGRLHLALNIAAMLISFLALIALTNGIIGWNPQPRGLVSRKSRTDFRLFLLADRVGHRHSGHDCSLVGNLLGTRMVIERAGCILNSRRSEDCCSIHVPSPSLHLLCAVLRIFSSIGIQIGGIGALAPNKRGELASLGFRAMLAGTMANLMSASIAGMLL